MPGSLFWLLFLFANVGGVAVMVAEGRGVVAVESFLRVLNGFAGYHLLHPFVRNEHDFRRLLVALLVAGVAPVMMGIYQAATGHVWSERYTVGLLRNVGIYHDAFSLRSYGFMALTGIILYASYFARSTLIKLLLFAYGLSVGLVVFKVYSKAAVVISVVWVFVWSLFRRRLTLLFLIGASLMTVDLVTGNRVVNEMELLFSKEVSVIEGTGDEKRALAGRGYIWGQVLEDWSEAHVINKLLGSGKSGGSSHNDFLRILVSGGVFGLLTYVMLLGVIGKRLLANTLGKSSPINVMALMVFLMWLIDSIGLTPGLYPGYQWFVWGIIGVALRGIEQSPVNRVRTQRLGAKRSSI